MFYINVKFYRIILVLSKEEIVEGEGRGGRGWREGGGEEEGEGGGEK